MTGKNHRKIDAVDIFCGIGGLTHGLRLAGISVNAGVDVDPSCRYAYEANNSKSTFITADIRDVKFKDLATYYQSTNITALVGCAPCQPFSAYNRGKKVSNTDCSLIGEFARLIEEGTPDLISMENVPGLIKHETFQQFVILLEKIGYHFVFDVLSCAKYGVPQSRKRLVLLASRLGKISLPNPTNERKNVIDFLSDTPSIKDGEIHPEDPAHTTVPLSEINRRRIRQSKPGGSWKDWKSNMINQCHKKSYYPAVYGRMSWNKLAPTITTQFCYYSTGRFGHPEEHRAISIREGALLQTFPPHYRLVEDGKSVNIKNLARHIGNAVPVRLAQKIGKSFWEAKNVQ